MKKFLWHSLAVIAAVFAIASCKDPIEPDDSVATLSPADLVTVAANAYSAWETDNVIPESLKVGDVTLTLPQYQYALCKLLSFVATGDKSDIKVYNYKPAEHPDRDSYDKDEIAVQNGPKINEGTEDIVSIAKRLMQAMEDKLQVPNQTLITRSGSSALAFSTNRATVTMLRTLAAYKKDGRLPEKVSTEYLSAASTLKGFAEQFVQILDIWQNTVGTVSADGSHCTDNNSAWQNVHFVPIPHSGGAYADGVDQYDPKYQPYFTVTIDGKTYTSAQTWGIALRGIMDLLTAEGSSKIQAERNTFEHTMANGAKLTEPIPAVTDVDIWGQYPWYESTIDAQPINKDAINPYIVVRTAAWFLARQPALGKIGNYQIYGTDPDETLIEEGYSGFISAMRMWLIAARFYKYLLDNNITENVYDAVKDVTFNTDLYGVEMPDIELKTKKVDLKFDGTAVNATFSAKKAWTATASESWIHVDPASGEAGVPLISIAISADANTGVERSGKVVIKGGNVTEGLEITVNQGAYVALSGTLKDFATEFVKGLEVWEATVGTVESEGEHLIEKGTAWTNVHFIPVGKIGSPYDDHAGNQHDAQYTPWKLNVNGQEITSSQAWEIAIRGLLNLVTTEGEAFLDGMTDRNKAYTLGDNKAFNTATIPNPSSNNKWGSYPWYEGANSDLVTYNGQAITEVDVNFMVKVGAWHVVRSFIAVGNNNPLGNVGNFQQFGTESSTLNLAGYSGLIAPMRELLILMRIYKYILDNNINENVYTAIKDQKFSFDLYNQGAAPVDNTPTIAEFATEFAKAATVWENTTGTVSYSYDGQNYSKENVHYVPDTYTITVKGNTYDKYQMHEIALNAFKTIENGGALTDKITAPKSYTAASARWHEYGSGLQETVAKADLLSNFATRCLNYIASNGEWPNVCGYPRTSDPVLTTYNGYVCLERDFLMMSRFFKYVMDNNITTNIPTAVANVEISTALYDLPVTGPTLKEFATEFVKGLDVWKATIGNVDADGERNSQSQKGAWTNVHYIPIGNTNNSDFKDYGNNQYDDGKTPWTLNINGTTYTSSQAWEIAIRGLLNLVTEEGQGFLDGMTDRNKAYTLKDNLGLNSPMPSASAANKWGKNPWYEFDDLVTYNGQAISEVDVNFILKVGAWHVVRSFVAVGNNSPLNMIGNFQQFGTASSTLILDGYSGLISPMRELMVLMRIYKYLLDNNIENNVYTAIKDQKFNFYLYGENGDVSAPSLKDFATEFVKGLDVWQNTVGIVESESEHLIEKNAAWQNVHFIPIVPNPNCEYLGHEGNQYDPKWADKIWKLNIKGTEYSSSQAWEIAIRGLLNLVTEEGEEFLNGMTDRNKAYTLKDNKTMASVMPSASAANQWGKHPWYEGANSDLVTYNGAAITNVDVNFMVKVGAWHVVRSFIAVGNNSPLGMIGNFQQFGTASSTLKLDGYEGLISPMRELMVLMRIYKYILDNNINENVYTAIKDQAFSFDLYGIN